jgi:deoxyribonuclease-4
MCLPLRVRQVLDAMTDADKKALKKLLPACPKMPDPKAGKYPSALLTAFGGSYSAVGVITEQMLRYPVEAITVSNLLSEMHVVWPQYFQTELAASVIEKVRKSKTTQPFLDCLVATRRALDTHMAGDMVEYDAEVGGGEGAAVVGHPDGRTPTKVVEIKLTGQLIKNWAYFQLQVFSYAALDPACKDVYLVLPMQGSTVWHASVDGWSKRSEFAAVLTMIAERVCHGDVSASAAAASAAVPAPLELISKMMEAAAIAAEHRIGNHMSKTGSLAKAIRGLPRGVPSQIFLGNPQSAKIAISDTELAEAAVAKAERSEDPLFIHAPYIINLAASGADYQIECLKKLLDYGATVGAAGVVVHVGKSTKQTPEAAMEAMRAAVAAVLPSATSECPLLLETPAGQGTEMLRTYEEFVGFVRSFATPCFRICVDTCHVFACGHAPLDYLQKLLGGADSGLLALVHFNDSLDICGACKDRHAPVGQGHIGVPTMKAIAELCTAHRIPAVIE